MKIILGDNQFFGVNHFDLNKGQTTKLKFDSDDKIISFIKETLEIGLDGFMINSNEVGYRVISESLFDSSKEIHYSIPYAHKYAAMVNENGMMSLIKHLYKKTSLLKNIKAGFKLLRSKNINHITSIAIDLELPKSLRKGSYVYIQNIMTDLLIGMGRSDVIIEFIENIFMSGYKPGLVTLNPIMLDAILQKNKNASWMKDLIVCFNLNKDGFNVFPNKNTVENLISSNPKYKLMAMSIFSSGASNIKESVDYIKKFDLDYVVFGTSKIDNVKTNLELFKNL